MRNKKIGAYGEKLAVKYLINKGYKILVQNWMNQIGELDIIATKRDILIIVEVKTRTNLRAGTPSEAISKTKFLKMERLALAWIYQYAAPATRFRFSQIQFDVIEVYLQTVTPRINHIKNVSIK